MSRKAVGEPAARKPSWAVLGILAALEVAWFAWILTRPLPSAGSDTLTRMQLLLASVPEVIPEMTWRESYLGKAAENLSHLENLPQRLPIVAAGGSIILAACALGLLLLRGLGMHRRWTRLERLAIGFPIGMTALGWLALICGRLGWLTTTSVRLGLGAAILGGIGAAVAGAVSRSRAGLPVAAPDGGRMAARSMIGLGLVVGPFLALMALGSMLPTIDFDAIEYHLEGPKEYFLDGRIRFLPHNVYTSMPFSVEMLHLLGMHALGGWWLGALAGQLVVASFAPMAGLAVWLAARRWGTPRAAWVATVVYLTTPWIFRMAAIPYVEGPLCTYHAALLWAAGLAWTASAEIRGRAWLVVGLLAGGSMAIKYPALISAVLPFGAFALAASYRVRSWRPVVGFGVGVVVVMAPWLIKNVVDTGNPVYPLGYSVFGGLDWDAAREAKWARAHGPRPIALGSFLASIVDVAGRSDWQTPALAALVPLAFLRRDTRRFAGRLAGYVAYIFLTWWLFTHRLDRFWLPLLPAAAILAGLGADWPAARSRTWTATLAAVLTVSIAANLVDCTTDFVGLPLFTGDLRKLRTDVPTMVNKPLARLDLELLPPGSKPLLVGQAQAFHLSRRVAYNTVFNRDLFESIDRDRTPEAVRSELLRLGITHIYVDWSEIGRYRSPGNYGYTDHVTPARFARLVAAGVLSGPRQLDEAHELYRVVPGR